MNAAAIARPMTALGEFFVLTGESVAGALGRPFAKPDLFEQIWFVARVSIFPTIMLSISDTVRLRSAATKPRSSSREYGYRRMG